jgi:Flp pilus assembly protein TadD
MYDVATDPAEERDVVGSDESRARGLAARVEKYSGPELPRAASIDADARQRLQSIGYLSGHPGNGTSSGRPDPKDRRELAARIAQVTSGEVRGDALRAALEGILADDPGNGQAHMRLGYALVAEGRCRDAERHFKAAIDAHVPSADPYLGLALCLGQRGEGAQAERTLLAAQRVEPGNPVVEANLGIAALAAGRADAAKGHLETALKTAPDLLQARFELARALATTGRRSEAAAQARDLLARLPADAPQRAEVERLLKAVER